MLNYRRFTRSFHHSNFSKIKNFNKNLDRVTVLSCSPSAEESTLIKKFEEEFGIPVRYLARKNWGIDQYARLEYFTGSVGALSDNLGYAYIFQMQEHYLDNTSPVSRYGKEQDFRPKEDVIPDNAFFDLDEMAGLMEKYTLAGMYCDRADPCVFTISGHQYIAPNGGHFIIQNSGSQKPEVQRQICRKLMKTCDNSYPWYSLYRIYVGVVFFLKREAGFLILKRKKASCHMGR